MSSTLPNVEPTTADDIAAQLAANLAALTTATAAVRADRWRATVEPGTAPTSSVRVGR